MSSETQRVDVLVVMRHSVSALHGAADKGAVLRHYADSLHVAKEAVDELIEAAKLVNGDHSAPHDCYATGPLTGDDYLDLVRCTGCQLAAALARVGDAS